MSCSYADGLTPYRNKGRCGVPEIFDDEETVLRKVKQLFELIKVSKHVVVHTGAGISTSAGIPDFRGPKGVWTLEKKGEQPTFSKSFDDAQPSITHMALKALHKANIVHCIITQNVDGLHLKSGFPRSSLAELHGNFYVQQCSSCERQLIAGHASSSVGQKCLNIPCPFKKSNGRMCRGKLHDTILDWEDNLPADDLSMAEKNSKQADLSIALGSTLQIVPSGNLPLMAKKNKGKFVVCNLQPTKHNDIADLVIHSYVDNVFILLCKLLGITIPTYSKEEDPTIIARNTDCDIDQLEWTLLKHLKDQLNINSDVKKRLKRESLETIDELRNSSIVKIEKLDNGELPNVTSLSKSLKLENAN